MTAVGRSAATDAPGSLHGFPTSLTSFVGRRPGRLAAAGRAVRAGRRGWYNPATQAEQWLIRPPAHVIGVTVAIPFYSRQNGNL